MRETFIAMLVMVGIAGTYYASKHHQSSKEPLSASSKVFNSSQKKGLKRKQTTTLHQGELDESTSHRNSQQVEPEGEGVYPEEGAGDAFEQAQSLPSIYQDEEAEQPGYSVSSEEELESESDETKVSSQTSPAKNPVVYGIPVASWLKQQKNRLASKVELSNPTGMRVFFNCLEIKKQGTETLTQKQCKEIAVSREKSRGAALIQ